MKKIEGGAESATPGYPTRREHRERQALLGTIAVGVSAIVAGCAGTTAVRPMARTQVTGGVLPLEPSQRAPAVNAANAQASAAKESTILSHEGRVGGFTACEPKAVLPGTIPVPAPVSTDKAPTERMMIYVIQQGDTLSALAERWMGGASRWPEIVKANPELVPEKLQVGRAIRLPVAGAASAN